MSDIIENTVLRSDPEGSRTDEIIEKEEETITQKPKRKLNENQMAAITINLAKGRVILAEKKQIHFP